MAKAEKVVVRQPVGEGGEEAADGAGDEEEVEIEETIEESRAERIKRSGLQRVENIKKAFSKENMEKKKQKTRENLEKTRQRTRENLEKTRQRTRENLDKTRQNLEQKMGKLGTERKEKLRMSREKLKKSLHLERSGEAEDGAPPRPKPKATTYRVPPFTFHVKKVREGRMELEKVEVEQEETHPVLLTGGLEEVSEEEALEVEVEEGVLVSLDSPEMEAVLEVADSSKLVLVDTDLPNQKKGK